MAQSTPSRREYFYVGGEYTNVTSGDRTSQVRIGHIYVEKLTPPSVTQRYPIVFIAGAGQTGTNFLETPDGRAGWASFFLNAGYIVYLSDQPFRGRSPWHPSVGPVMQAGTADLERFFTATSEHELWPQSKLHTQWPGTGKVGDSAFDAFYASQVQFLTDLVFAEEQSAKAYTALLDRIGEAHILTHSQSGTHGWRIGDLRPKLVKSIIALEPSGPPFKDSGMFLGPDRPWGLTYGPLSYEPSIGSNTALLKTTTVPGKDANHPEYVMQVEPARKLKNLAHIPVLVVTGEASYHQPYDYCTVEYLRQCGVQVEFVDLGKEGINGNGHMLFMEKNNIEIAERVLGWLKRL